MSKKETADKNYVQKNTMLLVAFITLVIGFLGGIVLSAYKSSTAVTAPANMPQQQAAPQPQQQQGPSAEQASRILTLEKAVSQNPENLAAWTQLGNVYFDTGQFKNAIKAYGKSLSLQPNNADVLTDLGVMYRRNGQPEKAVEAFDKAIQVNPRHEVSRFNKGIVLMHDLRDSKGALEAWSELVKMNPMAKAPNGLPIRDMIGKLKKSAN
jgi:cytochrome c-type biogenesis protein CcmH/NrfG